MDGLRSSHPLADAPKLLVRSGSEVYLPVQSGGARSSFVRVLRFDGRRWSTSLTVECATSPEACALSPDGAVWVVAGDDANASELWRRRPWSEDRWDHIAPESVGREAKLRVTSILPTRDGDLLFAGVREGSEHGLHRVHLVRP